MSARIFTLITLLTLFVLRSQGQTQQDSISTTKQMEKQVEVLQLEVPIYQLFPTENYWTFIKLDTRNGKMWQVHFTVSKEGYEGELILNSRSLVWTEEEEVNGRFTLYPTKNMYNFILLDQINGRTYQVQWNNDKEKRFVSRIY
ncbi:hypothetical protein LJC52_03540 [Bacteroidales bacterium OttesenSCG-928-A17]|nr:hypothetical protein [Bacteroidales bacterium OttesenSCG-928-A17]